MKKSMVAPLVFIMSGYFSQFAVFDRKKKAKQKQFYLAAVMFLKIRLDILTSKRSRRDPSRILHAVYFSNTVQQELRVKRFCTLNV